MALGLNPFEVREVSKQKYRWKLQKLALVLIPLKSGKFLNTKHIIGKKLLGLNPFEVREVSKPMVCRQCSSSMVLIPLKSGKFLNPCS